MGKIYGLEVPQQLYSHLERCALLGKTQRLASGSALYGKRIVAGGGEILTP